ncbi:MAG: site-2 protease family protein [Phycisphaeraceae bacterium]
MLNELFVTKAFDPATRFLFFAWVLVVIVSITLHELAHGFAARRRGDTTPDRSGHMTLNPLTHMGPFAIAALLIAGISWGRMPIDPSRMRGKYAEAEVASAGPSMNIVLAVLSAIGLGVMWRLGAGAEAESGWLYNLRNLLWISAQANGLLALFNLMPAPPLDGSRVLANFHRGYARFIDNPANQGVFMIMFIAVFAFATSLFIRPVEWAVVELASFVAGVGL